MILFLKFFGFDVDQGSVVSAPQELSLAQIVPHIGVTRFSFARTANEREYLGFYRSPLIGSLDKELEEVMAWRGGEIV